MREKYSLATRCVHAGEMRGIEGSPRTPIFNTTVFGFESTADLLDVVEGRVVGNLYTRYGLNPSIRSVEAKLASLENAESALVFSSGMAAAVAVFLAHGREGIIAIGNAYGGTLEMLSTQFPQLGITTQLLMGDEIDKLKQAVEAGAGLVFLETPSNPTMDVFDIRAISELAHAHGSLVVVDSTFASPVNQQPLSLGADLVVHSATKYLGGHDDLTAGALMGPKGLVDQAAPWRKSFGQVPSPETAYLLARSIRTLEVRVRRQNETAAAVAQAMSAHPRVARVLYPGLTGFSKHRLAKSQMSGFGGTLTIETRGDGEDAKEVVDSLRLFTIGPSLGGAESLATQPVTSTHHGLSRQALQRRGISDSMIRLSVGLESSDDLIQDLSVALGQSPARLIG